MKKALLLLSAVAALSSTSFAQLRCGSDEVNNKAREMYPEIVSANEAQLRQDINRQLTKMDLSQFSKTTTNGVTTLYVPIVFHVVHDYGTELSFLSDNLIHAALDDINRVYSKTNPDTSDVIATFAGNIPGTITPYIGNAHIQFKFAQKDPNGNPTKGITHRRSYLSNAGGDQAKGDQWPPQSYMNIWLIRAFDVNHNKAAAYAYKPGSVNGTNFVFYDGVICVYTYTAADHTLPHELGHTLNLSHPWGNTNNPNVACGDDGVDDTPPTKGHNPAPQGNDPGESCGPDRIYDTTCAGGYAVTYDTAVARGMFDFAAPFTDSFVVINYPDTNNSQNIMDYTYCSKMFTHLQTMDVRGSLQSAVANRSNLFSMANLINTGVADANGNILPLADLPPVADFSTRVGTEQNVFICAGKPVQLMDRSWNDTVTNVSWKFTDGAGTVSTQTSAPGTTVSPSFNNSGWLNIELTATSNAGNGVLTKDSAIYIASNTAKNAVGYFQEFNAGGDLDEYPIFNFYNNENKWEVVNNAGYYDQTSIRMKAFDGRAFPHSMYNTPIGDFDDFYTAPFDLSSFQGKTYCNLSLMASSATRVTNSLYQGDKLEISYMTDCDTREWTTLATLTKADLHNVGVLATEFTPTKGTDWQALSYLIPEEARTSKVYFRFRYTCGGDITSPLYGYMATGNNMYLDRISFNDYPTGVNDVTYNKNGFAIMPNPTKGNTTVVIKGVGNNQPININVTDVTGKTVYATQVQAMNDTRVEIPAQYISVKGIYLVNMISNHNKQTEKLVVY